MVAPVNAESNEELGSCHIPDNNNVLAARARGRIKTTNLDIKKREKQQ
jgi:hypothetical protein